MRRKYAYGVWVGCATLFQINFFRAVTWRGDTCSFWGMVFRPRDVWLLLGAGTFAVLVLVYTAMAILLGPRHRRGGLRPSLALTFYLALGTLLTETALLLRLPSLRPGLAALRLDFASRLLFEVGVLICFLPILLAVFPIAPLQIPTNARTLGRWGAVTAAFKQAYEHGRHITDQPNSR